MPQTNQSFLSTPLKVKIAHTALDLAFSYFEFWDYSELCFYNGLNNARELNWLNFADYNFQLANCYYFSIIFDN